jgi:hypothetical protein
MTRTEKLLRAAAEIEAMPPNLNGQDQIDWALATEHFKTLTFDEVPIAMQLARIAGVLADD